MTKKNKYVALTSTVAGLKRECEEMNAIVKLAEELVAEGWDTANPTAIEALDAADDARKRAEASLAEVTTALDAEEGTPRTAMMTSMAKTTKLRNTFEEAVRAQLEAAIITAGYRTNSLKTTDDRTTAMEAEWAATKAAKDAEWALASAAAETMAAEAEWASFE
jgi:hypothetical protein